MPSAGEPEIAVLTGPTASGKTETALLLAEALDAEIVSADSMAIYRGMDAGTAKPSSQQRERAPHHLIDVADPCSPLTVAGYRRLAEAAIDEIRGRGKLPLVVGGTRLYLVALTSPFDSGPPPDPVFRDSLSRFSSAELHEQLTHCSPARAAQLHPADRKRLVRALEIARSPEWRGRGAGRIHRAAWAALVRPREELYRRVDARVDQMLEAGLVPEVERLLELGLTPSSPAMAGHGYKEIMRALLGEYSLEEGIRLTRRNTRRYVKYQLIWLRSRPDIPQVEADAPGAAVEKVLQAFAAQGLRPHGKPA